MSSDFEWQVETDPAWRETEISPKPSLGQTKSLWLKISLLLTILSLSVAYFIVDNRANQVETAVHTDIIAAHDLIWQAAQRGDKELFNSLLLIKSQQQWQGPATPSHNPFNRPQLELTLQPQSSQIITVAVAPSLDTAQVTTEQLYETTVGDPLSLQHTYIYQQQDGRWLLSVPDAVFWGENQVDKTERLVISYPIRDAPLVQQLAADLNNLLDHLCQSLNTPCQPVLPLHFNLRTEGLTTTQMPLFKRATLPTPSLLGIPTDEDGYQTLFRYYSHHLTDLLWQLLPHERSLMHNGRLTQAAWTQLLIQHKVYPWPPVTTPQASTWPDNTLALLCLNEDHTGLDWWHYQRQTAAWHKVQSHLAITAVLPLADSTFLLQQKLDQQTQWLLTWPNGTHQIIHSSTSNQPQIIPHHDGRHLRLLSDETADILLIDITTCHQTTCAWQIAPGITHVSPNGRQQISQHGSHIIHDGDDDRPPTITTDAFAPFWLQDRFYGYLRPMPNSAADVQVFIRNTDNNETYPLLTTLDIRAQLPSHIETVIITAITPISNNINQVTIQLYAPEQDQTYTFAFYRSTGILDLLSPNQRAINKETSTSNLWFLEMHDGLINIQPPNSNQSYTLAPPTPACAYPTWE